MTIQTDKTIKEKIVLALDVDTIDEAKKLINELKDYVGVFKVGLQLYTKCGNEIIKFMNDENIKYFLDVKLYDIPNTVKEASKNIIEKGACFFNVHALGGYKMMNEAVNAANEAYFKKTNQNETKPIVLGVTILTSINDDVLHNEFEIENQAENLVITLAKLAKEAGLTGVVASPLEVSKIKEACGKEFKVLCPGIRPAFSNVDDQKRISTPKEAIKNGADFIVLGRAVTKEINKIEIMEKIYKEILND